MSQLIRLAAQLSYSVHSGIAYGRTGGIYFNAAYAPDGSSVTVRAYIRPLESLTFRDVGRGAGIDLNRISEYLKVRRREYPNSGAQADERSVWVDLEGEPAAKASYISQFIFEFSRFLSELGYVSSCAACPATRKLAHAFLDGQVLEFCDACQSSLGAQPLAEHGNTSPLRGAAGGAVGALIGVILWIVLSFNWIVASVCGLVMAYLADKGYRLAGGRRSRLQFVLIAAMLIVFTYVAVALGYAANEYRGLIQQGADSSLMTLIGAKLTAIGHPGSADAAVMWTRLGIGWLFAGLGGFALMLRQRRESSVQRNKPTVHIKEENPQSNKRASRYR